MVAQSGRGCFLVRGVRNITFIEELRQLRKSGKIPEWFTAQDVKKVYSNSEADNLSNYAKDNLGSSNRNKKVLERKKNSQDDWEYRF